MKTEETKEFFWTAHDSPKTTVISEYTDDIDGTRYTWAFDRVYFHGRLDSYFGRDTLLADTLNPSRELYKNIEHGEVHKILLPKDSTYTIQYYHPCFDEHDSIIWFWVRVKGYENDKYGLCILHFWPYLAPIEGENNFHLNYHTDGLICDPEDWEETLKYVCEHNVVSYRDYEYTENIKNCLKEWLKWQNLHKEYIDE